MYVAELRGPELVAREGGERCRDSLSAWVAYAVDPLRRQAPRGSVPDVAQVGPWTRMRRTTQEGTPLDQVPHKQRTAQALAAAQAASIGRVHMLAAS